MNITHLYYFIIIPIAALIYIVYMVFRLKGDRRRKQEWLEKYTDSEGRTRALSRKKFFDQQKGVMLKGENIRTRALRDIRNRLGLRRR